LRKRLYLKTKDFDYDLPEELIAQTPAQRRDHSRLMVLHRCDGSLEHKIFKDVLEYLQPEDTLVINDTRVLPARLIGVKAGSGGKIEVLLLKRLEGDDWEVLVRPGRKALEGVEIVFGEGRIRARVLKHLEEGIRHIRFFYDDVFEEALDEVGVMPLPPYIHATLEDRERYQTVYARHNGSAAAPTAGLHFTPQLLDAIREKGVVIVPVLLHVGLGTFRPVKVEDVNNHVMHSEHYEVTPEAADILNARRRAGGRIVCVGTTSARTLETVTDADGTVKAGSGETSIFIYPGYRFKAVDCLITNFHLPQSTLLMMISALADRQTVLSAYQEAVAQKYRFFSFGDAMLIL
jgi:S-adenosylmethionine:tRNA ribosyltransferase-isomerase